MSGRLSTVSAEALPPSLDANLRAVLEQLLPLLAREARRRGMSAQPASLRHFTDPEDGSEEFVAVQCVDASPEEALNYRDALGLVIEAWIETLPQDLAQLMRERVEIEVRWPDDG